MTVSFVLNNKPGAVSEETRARVLKAVREMGYKPHASHRRRESTIHTIGIAAGVPNASFVRDGYFQAILQQLMDVAEQRKLNTLLLHRDVFYRNRREAIRVHLDGHCEGLVLLAPGPDMPLVTELAERGVPFIGIGTPLLREDAPFVDIDNRVVGQQATEYLLSLGHRQIGFVGERESAISGEWRYAGYQSALTNHGLLPDNRLTYKGHFHTGEIEQWLSEMMSMDQGARPTALFAWNDNRARQVIQILKTLGVLLPEDISVIGVDDDPESALIDPALTTFRQPYQEIAETAVDALQARIQDRDSVPVRRLLECHLIERRSTAPPLPGGC